MKLFLSLPMHGRSNKEIESEIEQMKEDAKNYFDNIEFVSAYTKEPIEEAEGRLWYLGRAIQMMEGCDAILLSRDYEDAKGCLVEKCVAEKYGLKVYYCMLWS